MQGLIVLFILWVLVTCLGHLSWVVSRAIFNAIRGEPIASDPAASQPARPQDDVTATRRVLDRLTRHGFLDEQTTAGMRRGLFELERHERGHTVTSAAKARHPQPHVEPLVDSPTAPRQPRSAPDETVAAARSQPPLEPEEPARERIHTQRHGADPLAPVATKSSETREEEPPRNAVEERGLSFGEIIQSFLAAHNIRWGELAAGMLIVICSIGLVVSLWSPLVETHRVLPSLIFTAANAAIYAAGLYTLSRWKLRETSRAVLIIATLLVPLSVLAGLAAAGTTPAAVRLSDPITLGGIVVAGLVYLSFLFKGSKALVRSPFHHSIVAGVAAPVAMLPLIPALVRSLGASAGWSILFSTVLVMTASLPLMRRLRDSVTMGPAGGRVRLLFLSLSGFCLAIASGYCAFALRGFEQSGWMPIAIASVPAMIAMAGVATRLQESSRSSVQSMTGAVVGLLLVSASALILVPAMQSAAWMWAWAVAVSISLALVGWQTRQPMIIAWSTFPIGLAWMLGSTVWLSDFVWSEVSLWRRLIGGEPMIAALLVAAVVALCSLPLRQPNLRRALLIVAGCWVGWGSLVAAALAISVPTLLGVVPPAFVTGMMLIGFLTATMVSLRLEKFWSASVVGICFVWISIFRPISIPHSIATVETWLSCALSISASLLALGQFMPRVAKRMLGDARPASGASSQWRMTGIIIAVLAASFSLTSVADAWTTTATTLAIAVMLLLWGWLQQLRLPVWHAMQAAVVGSVVVLGYGRFESLLWNWEGWHGGEALFGWSFVLAASAAIGWLIRESVLQLGRWQGSAKLRRGAKLLTEKQYAASNAIDGWAAIGSVSLLILSAGRIYADLLLQRIDTATAIASPPMTGVAVAATAAAAVCWCHRRFDISNRKSNLALGGLATAAVVWGACAIASSFFSNPSERIVAATSMSAAIGLIALMMPARVFRLRSTAAEQSTAAVVGAIVGLSSLVLLTMDWRPKIVNGQAAEWMTTAPLTIWWLAVAVALLVRTKLAQIEQLQAKNADESNRNRVVTVMVSAILVAAAAALASTSVTVSFVNAIQIAAIAVLLWIVVARVLLKPTQPSSRIPINLCTHFVILVGVASALAATVSIVLPVVAEIATGPASFVVSTLTVVLWYAGWLRPHRDIGFSGEAESLVNLPWPIALSLLSGQIAWLVAAVSGALSAMPTVSAMSELAAGITVAASVASVVRFKLQCTTSDGLHVMVVAVCVGIACLIVSPPSLTLAWLSLAALACMGIQTAFVPRHRHANVWSLRAAHVLQWIVILFGGGLLLGRITAAGTPSTDWTILIAWTSAWVVAWRAMTHDRRDAPEFHSRVRTSVADMDWAGLLMLAVLLEVVMCILASAVPLSAEGLRDPLLWSRVACYLMVAASSWFRLRRTSAWTAGVGTLAASVALVAANAAVDGDFERSQRCVAAVLPAAFVVALLAHWISRVGTIAAVYLQEHAQRQRDQLGRAVWRIAVLVGVMAGAATAGLIATQQSAAAAQMCAAAVALAAWAIGVTAESRNWSKLRHLAIAFALSAVALLASIDQGVSLHPWLTGAMRWLVAAVVTIPTLLFGMPKLLGTSLTAKWYSSLRVGAAVSAVAATVSLVVMLMLEAGLREEGRIAGLPLPLVLGVAVVLGLLSLLAAVVAILSGPHSPWRKRLSLSDMHRRVLVVTAQVIGAMTWLHLFLCDEAWAFAGLRNHWPYAVMGLAFVSVAASEWARRKQDWVLFDTLAQTSLYLPLIPVAGFWLSGSQLGTGQLSFDWIIRGEVIQYEGLLALAAIYYLGVSVLWKRLLPRVTAIVLANAAWWVVLVQQPGWQFLAHPQAWLIPPAACVLIVAHLYRDRLDANVASAIRYASTLVIYVSSTADMLIQRIGENLGGPIVLVLLALLGMVFGVVLRVRPFLYLGATFVFIGVTSMVWHAHRSLDAVWPWWVFGITTGILILIALMAIEKNKIRLQRYSETLATWQ